MPAPLLHPVTLAFRDPALEAAFRDDHAQRSHLLSIVALWLGAVLYAVYGLLDRAVVPVAYEAVQMIRVVETILVVLATLWAMHRGPQRSSQALRMGIMVTVGVSLMLMTWVARGGTAHESYYGGPMIVLVFMHVLLRLRFLPATIGGGAIVVLYLAVFAATGPRPGALANNGFFLGSTLCLGMVASYALERYARREFLFTRTLRRSNDGLATALAQLRAAQARVVRQEKLAGLGRVASGVAHELRNPLNFVVNFADLQTEVVAELAHALAAGDTAEARLLVDDLAGNAARVVQHGRRAEAIVRRMQVGPVAVARGAVDLNALVAQRARPLAAGVDLVLDLEPAVGTLDGDADGLGRVVEALVQNAVDAVDGTDRATVRVQTRRLAGGVELRVCDTGPGLADAARARLFEPFFTTKAPGEGTGLGLFMAYDIVTNGHGGTIEAETDAVGACFRVFVPDTVAPTTVAPTTVASTAVAPAGPFAALVAA